MNVIGVSPSVKKERRLLLGSWGIEERESVAKLEHLFSLHSFVVLIHSAGIAAVL